MLNSVYLTLENVNGFAISVSHLIYQFNKTNLLNTVANAVYLNYRKINYYKMLIGITELHRVFQEAEIIPNWFYFQDVLSQYQLKLMLGKNIKNHIKSYDPELYFCNFQDKLDYMFQQFQSKSQVKIKSSNIDFGIHFYTELSYYLAQHYLKKMTNTDDEFIQQYLSEHISLEFSNIKKYTKDYLERIWQQKLSA
jgi:hypothetical protein